MFSDILLTADFDHTLTARDGSIPQRNLDAITYFIENGGTFTVNTGRNLPMSVHNIIGVIPMNTHFLFSNGCGVYDPQENRLVEFATLPLDVGAIVAELNEKYPHINAEIQCPNKHYLPRPDNGWARFNEVNRCSAWGYSAVDAISSPIMRLILRARFTDQTMTKGYESTKLYESTEAEDALFAEITDSITERFGNIVGVSRANKWITDIHPKECSKLTAARKLQQQLGKKILICVGDAKNDLPMLAGADYAFCPKDGAVANQFPNVCPCGAGAVADVIYHEIPKILKERENGNLL